MVAKKAHPFWLAISLAFMITGCAVQSGPTREQIENADYGPEPQIEDLAKYIDDTLTTRFKDPSSVVYVNIWGPKQRVIYYDNGAYDYGWVLCTQSNAKNSYGAYTGLKKTGMVFKRGRMTRRLEGREALVNCGGKADHTGRFGPAADQFPQYGDYVGSISSGAPQGVAL